ncbi:MAG: ATP-binding protein [bacterium]
MIISVASGKGGTGKTTISTSLALSLNDAQLLDCDVEEPNASIFIKPAIEQRSPSFIPIPRVDLTKCNYCGRCSKVCAFHAIAVVGEKIMIFPKLCHGCGACSYLCPHNAMSEIGKEIGYIETGKKNTLTFVHGMLKIGEAMSPPLIRAVKKHIDRSRTVIIDAPPGTSCPVITAIGESNYCLLVTEPTPFGLHDLILAVKMLRELKIPYGVIINRADIGNTEVSEYCRREGIPVLLSIPFKKDIAIAYSKGLPLIEALPEYDEKMKKLFTYIRQGK